MANVYHPSRLTVVAACKTVTGVVDAVRHETDGDYHIALRLDAPYAGLVNAKNASAQHGALVVEIVPADETACTVGQPPRPASGTYSYGFCTGADLAVPTPGTRVTVTGPYVLDRDHGWMEIHPAWALSTGGAAVGWSPPAPSGFQLNEDEASSTTASSPPAAATPPPPALAPAQGPSAIPTNATAVCRDGTYSMSAHRSGTCSHHGGVQQWVNRPAA